MADNNAQEQQDRDEFSAAFREAAGPDEVAADEAGEVTAPAADAADTGEGAESGAGEGLNLDAAVAENDAADAAAEGSGTGDAGEGGAGTAVIAVGDDAVKDLEAEANAAASAPDAGDGDRDAEHKKREDRLRSWEGRIKAMAREKGLPEDPDDPAYADKQGDGTQAESLEAVADAAEASGDGELAQAAEELAEKVEVAQITPEEARRILAEDFGDGFLQLLDAVNRDTSGKHANEQMEALRKSTSEEIENLKNASQRTHYRTIERAHKDFQTVVQSPEFLEFVEQDPARKTVVESGDAFDAIELLDAFKASQQTMSPQEEASKQSAVDEDDLAVRATGGLRLPAKASKDQSYEEAWAES